MEFIQPLSEDIFKNKYMINKEKSADEVFREVAKEIARVESSEIRSRSEDNFYRIMNEGYFIPGGRILANARTYTHKKSKNYNNCFTIDIEDSMEHIYSSVYEDAMISRMGGGVGFNISKLRPKGSLTTNGGEASGPLSFLQVFNASAATISSGGARRSAHIALLDIDHPDIEEFITAKQGDAKNPLKKFNISVAITDKFMRACEANEDWDLKFNNKVYRTVKARALYDLLAQNAFIHNEPGVFFVDTAQKYNNSPWAFKLDRVNPCGEICMPSYSLCCLGALNLTKFVKNPFTGDVFFDFDAMRDVVYWAIRFLDNVLDATEYPLEKIETFSKQWRRVGLGFTGLGSALAMMGIVYGSEKSIAFCNEFGEQLRNQSYLASVYLAKEKGMAPGLYNNDKVDERLLDGEFIRQLPASIRALMKECGLRNIGLNTCAPTGTISLSVGNNCSSGIEPIFSLEYFRNIRTGMGEETTKERVADYAYLLYKQLHPTVERVPNYFVTTFSVDPYESIKLQSTLQKYIDHSISKTLNLPKGYTIDKYKDLFMFAYKQGLKGFTSFNPEGSMEGILEAADSEVSFISREKSPKRPKELPCDIFNITVKNQDFVILAGKLNGSVYEIFADEKNGHDFGNAEKGMIIKEGKGEYRLVCDNGMEMKSLAKNFVGTYGVLTRMISLSLRNGVMLTDIIEQLQRSKEFLGFEKAVSRVLKYYIREGEKFDYREKCPECGTPLVLKDGCPTCSSCGWARCS